MARSGSSSYQMSASRMSGGKLRRGVHRGESPVVADLLLDQTDPSPLSPLPSPLLLPSPPGPYKTWRRSPRLSPCPDPTQAIEWTPFSLCRPCPFGWRLQKPRPRTSQTFGSLTKRRKRCSVHRARQILGALAKSFFRPALFFFKDTIFLKDKKDTVESQSLATVAVARIH